ncbi:MAG: glutathione S-transferase family protein [Pseudomonadota bacterium]
MPAVTDRLLYQFPLSHYCEKTRWHMDIKGLSYRTKNLFPGLHRSRTQKLAGSDMLPLLHDQNRWIADSTDIALYLEKTYPEKSLLPADPEQRAEVIRLEAYFDDLGDQVRRWVFADLVDSPDLGSLMFSAYALPTRLLGKAMMPLVRTGLRKLYKLSPTRVAEAHRQVLEGLEEIERLLHNNPNGYLVGGQLTLADITAASMFGPLIGPVNSPWGGRDGVPPRLADLRQASQQRVAGQWMLRLYREKPRV